MSSALVFVLVPYSVAASDVSDHAFRLIQEHQSPVDHSRGWYCHLTGILDPVFDDPIAEGRLPDREKRVLHRRVCDVERIPKNLLPYALVTPDGSWHSCEVNILDYAEFGQRPAPDYYEAKEAALESWPRRFAELIASHAHCWVVAERVKF